MNTNFFKQVAAMNITGDLQLIIKQGTDNNYIVSVLLHNEQCGDNAKKLIPPLLLKGTAEELDNGFFESIAKPIEQTSSLLLNMEGYLKQQEVAKQQSAMEKEKADKEKKAKDEKDRKYKEAIQKVDELEKEGKYRDAWMKLPDPAQYPEQAETINKRRTALSDKFAPDRFGTTETTVTTSEPQPENTLFNENPDKEEFSDDEEDNWEDNNEIE